QVAQTHEPLIIPDYQEWAGRSTRYTGKAFQSVMAAPLMIGNRLVGSIASVRPETLTERFAGRKRVTHPVMVRFEN
ncbi:MAG: hypothetical protein ABIV11_07275, partial [Gemmatimonadaceae bacterium]